MDATLWKNRLNVVERNFGIDIMSQSYSQEDIQTKSPYLLDRLSNKGDSRATHPDTVTQILSLSIEQKPAHYNKEGRGRSYIVSIYLYFSNYFTDNRVTRARNGDHTRQRVAQDFLTSVLRAIVERSRHARNCFLVDMKGLKRSLYRWSITDTFPVILCNFLTLLACDEIGF